MSALEDKRENSGEQPDSMSSLEEKPEGDITSSLADKPECGEDSGEQQPVYVHVMLGGGCLLLVLLQHQIRQDKQPALWTSFLVVGSEYCKQG